MPKPKETAEKKQLINDLNENLFHVDRDFITETADHLIELGYRKPKKDPK